MLQKMWQSHKIVALRLIGVFLSTRKVLSDYIHEFRKKSNEISSTMRDDATAITNIHYCSNIILKM